MTRAVSLFLEARAGIAGVSSEDSMDDMWREDGIFVRDRMKTATAFLFLLAFASTACAQPCESVQCIDTLFRDIYSLKLSRASAVARVREAHALLRSLSRKGGIERATSAAWVFPLRGHSAGSIGGRGTGYRGAASYDFFSGNSHGGHPAHDVFIRDRDFDDLDDKTSKPVDVLSVSAGIVISVTASWSPDSMDAKGRQPIRSGICAWIYDPVSDCLFYYAHLRRAACTVGQTVRPGDRLGEVGRTGKNAYPHRSPTHLHFMVLSFRDGLPRPRDIYPELLRASTR
ncbi:MAG: M23 family metallopeptidase [Ignavibacteria bacterium]|nr:M23 family metallopeptidase [Ignavibacteria bacterium]